MITQVLTAIAAIGIYAVLFFFDLQMLIITPFMLYALVVCWKKQEVGYWTREGFPGLFWGGLAIIGLCAVFGLEEYWAVIQRLMA